MRLANQRAHGLGPAKTAHPDDMKFHILILACFPLAEFQANMEPDKLSGCKSLHGSDGYSRIELLLSVL